MFPGFLFGPAKWAQYPFRCGRRIDSARMGFLPCLILIRGPGFSVISRYGVEQRLVCLAAGRIAAVPLGNGFPANQATRFLAHDMMFQTVHIPPQDAGPAISQSVSLAVRLPWRVISPPQRRQNLFPVIFSTPSFNEFKVPSINRFFLCRFERSVCLTIRAVYDIPNACFLVIPWGEPHPLRMHRIASAKRARF